VVQTLDDWKTTTRKSPSLPEQNVKRRENLWIMAAVTNQLKFERQLSLMGRFIDLTNA
jgi:hypothetical protein